GRVPRGEGRRRATVARVVPARTGGGMRIIALMLLAVPLHAQVDAALRVHGRDAEMRVANPTQKPLGVSVTLFRDVTLVDTIACRITPRSFTLQPGGSQVVRVRLREPMKAGTTYRLGTTFMPPENPTPGLIIALATRILTRV